MKLTEFLSHFPDYDAENDGWVATCPAHNDSHPSLRVAVTPDGKALLKCRAGCDTSAVLAAAGLSFADLENLTDLDSVPTVQNKTPANDAARGMVAAQAYGWAATLAAIAPYGDPVCDLLRDRFGIDPGNLTVADAEALGIGYEDGRLMVVARTADGHVAFVQGRAVDPTDPVRWKGLANPSGGHWDAAGFVGKVTGDRAVIVCEGPSDALCVAALDAYDVIAIRGASQGRRITELAGALKGRTVYVAGDGDSAGRKFNRLVAEALEGVADQVLTLPVPDGKDIGDVRKENPAEFQAVFADMVERAEAPETAPEFTTSVKDVHIGARVAVEYLRGKFVAWGKNAWSKWDGKRWDRCTDTTVFEAVRLAVLDIHRRETEKAREAHARATEAAHKEADPEKQQAAVRAANKALTDRMKELATLFNVGKLDAIRRVARGLVEVDQTEFDSHADLLNVGNGVVDLRTGELRPHDPKLMFTKVTPTNYVPGATHADWDKALTALPAEVADWMQVRFGQAATGYATPDDIVPFLHGGGGNGKSSVIDGVIGALGKVNGFAVQISDKVLLGATGDHPTEFMNLKGARFAYIEELPEGDYLNAQRLKRIAGTAFITARYIGENNVTWEATHSVFVTTNYDVKIDAVDHGTWRRLALVNFPYKFDGSDPEHPADRTLRQRIQFGHDGQHEAVLAWLVEGAKRWYANGRIMPPAPEAVRRDTNEWKANANQAIRFLDEHFELAPGYAVKSTDMYEDFKEWAEAHGIRKWGDQLFWSRVKQHDWFATGKVHKPNSVVRTSGWKVDSSTPGGVRERERLVTGLRRITGTGSTDQTTDEGTIFAG